RSRYSGSSWAVRVPASPTCLLLLQRSDPIFLLLVPLRALLLWHLVAPRWATLLEAVAAVHGLVSARLERNARLASAVAACRGEHLALAAAVSAATTATVVATTAAATVPTATTTASATLRATRGTVSGATGGGVLESAARVKLL